MGLDKDARKNRPRTCQPERWAYREDNMKYIFGGYYLVQGVDKPSWISNIISTPVIWVLTDCICDFMPTYTLLPGCESTDEIISEISNHTGLSVEEIESMKTTVENMLSTKQLGWPNVFHTLDSAQDFYEKHLSKAKNFKILGIAFSEKDAEEFLIEENPNNSQDIGILNVLSKRQEIPSNINSLGFEILGHEYGGDFHSFLCNGLEKDFAEKLGITFNETGRMKTYEDAKRAEEYINDESVGAEPVPWYACLVFEEPLTHKSAQLKN